MTRKCNLHQISFNLLFPYLNFTLILLKYILSSQHFFLFLCNVSILLFSSCSVIITDPFSCDLPCHINSFRTLYFSDFTPPCFINSFIQTFSPDTLISTSCTVPLYFTHLESSSIFYTMSPTCSAACSLPLCLHKHLQ